MPNKNSPPKHKTQNYRLVTTTYEAESLIRGNPPRRYSFSKWEPVPLRSDRKDLNP